MLVPLFVRDTSLFRGVNVDPDILLVDGPAVEDESFTSNVWINVAFKRQSVVLVTHDLPQWKASVTRPSG
jgi:ABC-type phosphate transport system ATPase subunit